MRLVGPIVVLDDVDIEVGRHLGFDRVQELAELDGAMAAVQRADHPAGFQVQRGEQRGRTVPLIIVGPSLRLARTKGATAVASGPAPESAISRLRRRPRRDRAGSCTGPRYRESSR